MGRYLRRSSRLASGGEVEVVPPAAVLGVRTRSKVHRHQQQQHAVGVEDAPPPNGSSSPYLQLRSRRLDRGYGGSSPRKSRGAGSSGRERVGGCVEEDGYDGYGQQRCGPNFLDWGGAAAAELSGRGEDEEEEEVRRMVAEAYDAIIRWQEASGGDDGRAGGEEEDDEDDDDDEESVQASCGHDGGLLQVDVVESRGERFSRETTPCSLVFSSDAVRTPPGSTSDRRAPRGSRRLLKGGDDGGVVAAATATTREMEEFFTCAEQEQQRVFVDKYNFDVANECPLPGRYEWEKVGSCSWRW